MRNLAIEQILLIAIFILAPLLNFILQRLKRRLEDQAPPDQTEDAMRRRPQDEASETVRRQPRIVIVPAAEPIPMPSSRRAAGRERAPVLSTPERRPARAALELLRSPQDVRRGIIMMTILGPCRANDPQERRPF